MDKPLSHKEKDNSTELHRESKPGTSVKGYTVPIGAYNPEISEQNWNKKQGWNAGPGGRAVIRLFSRGMLGSAFFALGGWFTGNQGRGLLGYKFNFEAENKLSRMFAASEGFNQRQPLHYVARVFDQFAGKAIYGTLKTLGINHPDRWVKFRSTTFPSNARQPGRTLGAEAVGITFDFFSASVGDALGRDIADNLDPHNKKKIWKDKKGRTSLWATIDNTGKTVWRYLTYNGGEDWAVALPYAYWMRAQRHCLNRVFPGYAVDVDRSLNGASFKYNGSSVRGNYNIPGMLDLQGRFTAYNMGTLMFRELHDHIGNKLRGQHSTLYGSPERPRGKDHTFVDTFGDTLKWGVRSVVKAGIYMTPVVPFFSVFRTSQSKYKGIFIDKDTGAVVSYKDSNERNHAVFANEKDKGGGFTGQTSVQFQEYKDGSYQALRRVDNTLHPVDNPLRGDFNAYGQCYTRTGKLLDKLGAAQNRVRKWSHRWPDAIRNKQAWYGKILTRETADRYVNSVFAYTPYMYAKGEAAIWFDNGKTDAAVERLIDGVDKLDFHEVKEGAGEVWRALWHKPFKDPARDAEGELRRELDTSAADDATKHQVSRILDRRKQSQGMHIPWQQRLIQGQQSEIVSKTPKPAQHLSHAEQEDMRQALQNATPPTNSIH